jgi:hypothetical protein
LIEEVELKSQTKTQADTTYDPLIISDEVGTFEWCALGEHCKIKQFPAPARVMKCCKCHLAVHRGCGAGALLTTFACNLCTHSIKEILNPYRKRNTQPQSLLATQTELVGYTTTASGLGDIQVPPSDLTGNTNGLDVGSSIYNTPVRKNFSSVNSFSKTIASAPQRVEHNQLSRETAYTTRFDLRINIPNTINAVNPHNNKLRAEIETILQEMKKIDPDISLSPWFDNSKKRYFRSNNFSS